MQNELWRGIAYHPELSKNDSFYLLTILDLQSRKERITHEGVAGLLGDSIHTVRRSFKTLRKRGFLSAKRVGPTEWKYEVLMQADLPKNDRSHDPTKNDQPQDTKYPLIYRENTNNYILNSNNTLDVRNSNLSLVKNDCLDPTLTEGKRQTASDPIGSYQSHQAFGFSLEICVGAVRKEEGMSLVAGPKNDGLSDTINSALEKSNSARKERKERQQKKSSEKVSNLPTKYEAGRNKQIEAMAKKDISEYGCHEMWYIFRDAWNAKWKGKPSNWKGPEYRMVKDMLKEYSPEEVVGFLRYSIENWEGIRTRHRSASYPTFKIIYGLRGQIMAEYHNGPLAKLGEYSQEYDHIKDGEWG